MTRIQPGGSDGQAHTVPADSGQPWTPPAVESLVTAADFDAVINAVPWRAPWTLDGFIQAVGELLGLQIKREARYLGPLVSGFLVVLDTNEAYLWHQSDANPVEAKHVLGHEVWHLLGNEYDRLDAATGNSLRDLATGIPLDQVTQAACRTTSREPAEWRAEQGAYSIDRAIQARRHRVPPPSTTGDMRWRSTFHTR
jgi:hypothetical protein